MVYIILPKRVNHIKAKGVNSTWPKGSKFSGFSNTYWFRCAGGFGWITPIKKTFTFEELNAIRKLEFVVEDDPNNAGKVQISIYINDELYGTQAGRTDIYAMGAGTPILIEAGQAPAAGDYMVIKSITYTPNE